MMRRAVVYSSPTFDSDDNIIGSLILFGANINAEGGWWDAGDYLKFVQTESYVVTLMLIGVRDFPSSDGLSFSTTSNFTNEAQFGIQLAAYRCGTTRHWNFVLPGRNRHRLREFRSSQRSRYLATAAGRRHFRREQCAVSVHPASPGICCRPCGIEDQSEPCGTLAADFAECFQVYDATNPALANQCLVYAEHIFDLADTAPSGNLLITAPFDFYPEGEWRDDLELGRQNFILRCSAASCQRICRTPIERSI